jgi:hypothetical protein
MKLTSHLEEVSVFERAADRFCVDNPKVKIVHGQVSSIDTINKIVHIQSKGKAPVICFDPIVWRIKDTDSRVSSSEENFVD